MELERLFEGDPKFHRSGSGECVSYGLSPDVLRYIAQAVCSGAKTLETGSGLSTLVFAARKTRHTCITPDPAEAERIAEYCRAQGVDLGLVDFIIERSETALPRLNGGGLDLVLIDGNHAFPAPFIDYYYAAERMKVGGVLIVDDTQLWTGRILKEFLSSEPEWRLDREFPGRAAAFTKLKDNGHLKWWGAQPFVKARSAGSIRQSRLTAHAAEYLRRVRGWIGA